MSHRRVTILYVVNVPRVVCDHVVGEHHTPLHRMIAGLAVMTVGVLIAHTSAPYLGPFLSDELGYAVHGLGLTPFAEFMAAAAIRR